MLDEDNYPDENALKQIEHWDILKQPITKLLDLIEENTHWADRQIERRGKRVIYYAYHTGGWSGNEDVIKALKRNYLFWAMFWKQHNVGGHYRFKIDLRKHTRETENISH